MLLRPWTRGKATQVPLYINGELIHSQTTQFHELRNPVSVRQALTDRQPMNSCPSSHNRPHKNLNMLKKVLRMHSSLGEKRPF
jgi:hypothetical protein